MFKQQVRAGIIGAAGYTGGELIRLLLRHPGVQLVFACSSSNAAKPVYEVHSDLFGETDLVFTASYERDIAHIDVLFLCQGHGAARRFLAQAVLPEQVRVIDLSQDFRLAAHAEWQGRRFVYGLPELNRPEMATAQYVANPGCFATALQLALLPLAAAGLLGQVYATGITGSTGAGQALSETTHFSWRTDNISAYKTLDHQHVAEIMQSLDQVRPAQLTGMQQGLWFVPWRGDFARGIYISATLDCPLDKAALLQLYSTYYEQAAFTHVSTETIHLKQVVNTNKCLLHIEQSAGKTVIHAAIDNLLKGASGQAVQNMNLMFGLPEQSGLGLKASAF